MKPIYLPKETRTAEGSFFCRYAEVPYTYDKFHYHKEYEMLYHIRNSGIRFIGDSIRRFSDGDLVLVGPNIPHYWHSDDKFYRSDPNISAQLIVVHFVIDFAGPDFFNMPEMNAAKSLLERAKQGIQICGPIVKKLAPKLVALPDKTGWERVVSLISILNEMGETAHYNLLASSGFCNSFYKSENEGRITDIYNFLMENYSREVSLEEVAAYAKMNTSAFCRFFKNATNKTFSHVLNEIRIGIACKKLINSFTTVAEIGYDCGFHSISYFNRQFRKVKKMTPMEYRLRYINKKPGIPALL